jgi:hypothetical protein
MLVEVRGEGGRDEGMMGMGRGEGREVMSGKG